LGKKDKSGYNRLKQNADFCFRTFFVCVAGVSMFAASAPDGTARESGKVQTRSVVRVDPSTGRLVRVIDVVRSPRAPNKRSAAAAPPNVHSLVETTARSYDVDPLLVESVIQTESAYQPGAVSPKGAQGLMQLMPATARRFGVNDSFDPKENIEGGVKYLKYLQNLFQDDRLAIAAYNAGEGAVAKYNGVPPYKETVAYVEKVSRKYGKAKEKTGPAVVSEGLNSSEAVPETRPVIAYTDSQGRWHMTTQ
jgi:soluble lytic murein transglycosylase-like protein